MSEQQKQQQTATAITTTKVYKQKALRQQSQDTKQKAIYNSRNLYASKIKTKNTSSSLLSKFGRILIQDRRTPRNTPSVLLPKKNEIQSRQPYPPSVDKRTTQGNTHERSQAIP